MTVLSNMLAVVAASVASSVIVSEYQDMRFHDKTKTQVQSTFGGATMNTRKMASFQEEVAVNVTDEWVTAVNILNTPSEVQANNPDVKFELSQCYWPDSIGLDTPFSPKWAIRNDGTSGELILGVDYGGAMPVMFWREDKPAGYERVIGIDSITMRDFYETILDEGPPAAGYNTFTFYAGYIGVPWEPPEPSNGFDWQKVALYGGLGLGAIMLLNYTRSRPKK